jgi:hypothetical protein
MSPMTKRLDSLEWMRLFASRYREVGKSDTAVADIPGSVGVLEESSTKNPEPCV